LLSLAQNLTVPPEIGDATLRDRWPPYVAASIFATGNQFD